MPNNEARLTPMETGKRSLGASSSIVSARTLRNVLDSALERKSNVPITFPDSLIGVSVDTRGDWTITVGLSIKSDRFNSIAAGLEKIGFFQATENEGSCYFLWTSLLVESDNANATTEQVLAQAVMILQAPSVSQYIS